MLEMMKNDSFIDRVRDPQKKGPNRNQADQTNKERGARDFNRRQFIAQDVSWLKGLERNKTPEEVVICGLVGHQLNKIRRGYGLHAFALPERNVHIIRKDQWDKVPNKGKDAEGGTDVPLQLSFIKEQPNLPRSAHFIFHEGRHLMTYNALKMSATDNPAKIDLLLHQQGISYSAQDNSRGLLTSLVEAANEESWIRNKDEILTNPVFDDAMNNFRSLQRQYGDTEAGRRFFKLPSLYYGELVLDHSAPSWMVNLGEKSRPRTGELKPYIAVYPEQRNIFNTLLDKVLAKNTGVFEDREAIFRLFDKAMFTGDLALIWKVVDQTFGNGTLNTIAELDANLPELKKYVENL